MSDKIKAHIFISGRVQGVFFRQNTCKKAEELGICGWVRNTPDGRVEAVFEGEKEKVKNIVEWSKKGPIFAKVNNIDIKWEEPNKEEFDDFRILHQ